MNNDYLWDKTGSDTEIEGLENTLSRFRYAEVDPPELPATNIIEFAKTPRRRWFAIAFAAAACVTLVMLAGVLLRSGETGNDLAKKDEIAAPAIKKEVPPKSSPPLTKIVETAVTPPTEPVVPAAATSTSRPRATRAKHRVRRKQAPLTLTADEKYAYDQLMLALSITGSKLRVVRDMIDGPDGKAAGVVDR